MNEHKIQNKHRVPPQPHDAERGQAIVLMALMMIVLLAMLGLAIDGGGLYFKWRDLQNATDAAALAAAYQRCADPNPTYNSIQTQGVEAALDNGFDNNGVDNIVTVYWPPSLNAPTEVQGNDHYVEVQIWAEKPAYFINVVYKGRLTLENTAIGFCVEKFDPATVPAIMALGSECTNDMQFGIAELTVVGGVFSNGNIQVGGCGQDCEINDGAGAVQGIDPNQKVTYPDGSDGSAQPKDDPLPYTIEQFAPTGKYWNLVPISRRTWVTDPANPDPDLRANGVWDPSNGRILRGLYFVDGDVTVSNRVNWDATEGVTIVATGTIDVNAPQPPKNIKHYYPTGTEFPGLLLFSGAESANCGQNVLQFSGSNMDVTGVLYAPKGTCTTSHSQTYIYGAVICWNINVQGSWGYIEYTPELLPPISPKVSIAE